MTTEYLEENLDSVMRYFARAYESEKHRLVKYEFTIDTHTRKVIFKLYLEDK